MHEASFTFQANPRAIEQQPKYRNDSQKGKAPCLISVDPRVCRGSTFSNKRQTVTEEPKPKTVKKAPTTTNRTIVANIDASALAAAPQKDTRIDLEIQTEPYLQEIVEKPIISTIETQTDEFLDRPETPPYIPPKNGIDKEIQVIEGDLFDFDFEVQPIVSTIVGKTLEQAFLEVHEEEELLAIRRHKDAIEHQRNVELADIQRLEEAEKRKFEEKENRLQERERIANEQKKLQKKIAARGFAEFYSSDLLIDSINLLERKGFFYDEIEREVQTTFIPWLNSSLDEASETQKLVQTMIQTVEQSALVMTSMMVEASSQTLEYFDDELVKKRNEVVRKMIAEDVVSAALRKAKTNKKKTSVHKNDEEEERND